MLSLIASLKEIFGSLREVLARWYESSYSARDGEESAKPVMRRSQHDCYVIFQVVNQCYVE